MAFDSTQRSAQRASDQSTQPPTDRKPVVATLKQPEQPAIHSAHSVPVFWAQCSTHVAAECATVESAHKSTGGEPVTASVLSAQLSPHVAALSAALSAAYGTAQHAAYESAKLSAVSSAHLPALHATHEPADFAAQRTSFVPTDHAAVQSTVHAT